MVFTTQPLSSIVSWLWPGDSVSPSSEPHRHSRNASPNDGPPSSSRHPETAAEVRIQVSFLAPYDAPSAYPSNDVIMNFRNDHERPVRSGTISEWTNIRKPEGEAGRPGRGGYNLRKALGWGKRENKCVQEYVNRMVERHLDLRKPFTKQSYTGLRVVRTKAKRKFPFLANYADDWVINDLMRASLKYRTNRSKLNDLKMKRSGSGTSRNVQSEEEMEMEI
ncbi:hypothetical protein VKT23_008217 [Stygiomarasmius scandens]|uniref:Uncharacterized protein n=1 Tax=Marasmiellus scandens TaxID=2682957 RepID=A0ABR1JJU3_9AGAR